jgi:hypothetical protein
VDPFGVPPTPTEQKALTPEQVLLSADARGMIPSVLNAYLGDPDQAFYFQRDKGKVCLTRFNNGVYEKTPARLAQQEKMRQAVAAWQALPPEQKEIWNQDKRAADRRLSGYDLFLSLFLKGQI